MTKLHPAPAPPVFFSFIYFILLVRVCTYVPYFVRYVISNYVLVAATTKDEQHKIHHPNE